MASRGEENDFCFQSFLHMRLQHILWWLCVLLILMEAHYALAQSTEPVWSEQCSGANVEIECRLREPLKPVNACFPLSNVRCCGCNAASSRCYACPTSSDCGKEACLDRIPKNPKPKHPDSFKSIARTSRAIFRLHLTIFSSLCSTLHTNVPFLLFSCQFTSPFPSS